MKIFFLITIGLLTVASSFVLKHATTRNGIQKPSLIPRNMDAAAIQDIETARTAFVLCFFGAVGSAAVGREVIPVTFREYKKTLALRGKGASLGGPEMDLFGYPEPVYSNDVLSILNNNMSVFDMIEEYPVEGALPGYLRFESLALANAERSQIAVRAVFDSIATGINKNQVSPYVAERKMEQFKGDLDLMKQNSQLTKTIGVTALVLLLSIIGSADFFAVYHLLHGWFPGWQGFAEFPTSLLDERGITSLPSFFTLDVPMADGPPSGSFPMM